MSKQPHEHVRNIREKDWVSDDDEVRVIEDYDPDWHQVQWTHDNFIAYVQIQDAFDDEDIEVCDIEADGDSPIIHLDWVGK